ncbi:MAG: hypothetical protein IPN92_10060 [Chromatiaceae bacterium]|nr:hypothetical protein [Chromatiaceae bacterium]
MQPNDQPSPPLRGYSTNELAGLFKVVPHTIRVSVSARGQYMGLIPTKLPNGRLWFDAQQADAIALGKVA